jgi:hypothetical protein
MGEENVGGVYISQLKFTRRADDLNSQNLNLLSGHKSTFPLFSA